MNTVISIFPMWILAAAGISVQAATVSVDAEKVIAEADRSKLLGINIAVYNQPAAYREAMTGTMADLDIGLVRMPGGSASDKYYWNGNGVFDGQNFDMSKFKDPYWQIDYSDYRPGFWIDSQDWSKADGVNMDAKTMHEVTRLHPNARNMVTVNVGSGTPEMAAEWVRWANIKNNWGVEYWELGNELNGHWETGHIRPDGSTMTAEKYVELYVEFAKAMKAVDPTIKIGGPSCDMAHPEYFEPLLRDAGGHVDFITLHSYWLRTSFATEEKLFAGVESLNDFAAELDRLVAKYQPDRVDEIETSVTEWNSKLPKDKDAYRLINGLWFASWIGEIMAAGIDSATVWDMFSGKDMGHGMLVQKGDTFVPTGRYWGFWLWSKYMADTMVQAGCSDNSLRTYATRDGDVLNVMLVNESREKPVSATLDLGRFKVKPTGSEVTLSSREYFWNPLKFEADWNSGPSVRERNMSATMNVEVPPFCVKVLQFNANPPRPSSFAKATADVSGTPPVEGTDSTPLLRRGGRSDATDGVDPELRILLPESGMDDIAVEGWVRAFREGSDQPYAEDLGDLTLTADGAADVQLIEPLLTGAASRFILTPKDPGNVTLKAECGKLKTEAVITFEEVVLEEFVAWDFESGKLDEPHETFFDHTFEPVEGSNGKVLRFAMEGGESPGKRLIEIKKYPRKTPRGRIGGVRFDLMVSSDFNPAGKSMQVVLQSENDFWIPCGSVNLSEAEDKWTSFAVEIGNKTKLEAMEKGFCIQLILPDGSGMDGTICLDNLGFLLRPETK